MRTAVVDSSTLINLVHLDLIRHLSLYFDRVYVPRAVHKEVNKKGKFRHRLNRLYEKGIFAPCTVADETILRLLRSDPLDEGEAEALTQAQEKEAAYFIADDKRARAVGQNMGRKPIGTLRILARLNLDGHAPDLSILVRKLRKDLGFRASEEVVRQAMEAASEPI